MEILIPVVAFLLLNSQASADVTYHSLYQDGVEAYNQGQWVECYTHLMNALQDYHKYHQEVTQCWKQCGLGNREVCQIDIDASNFLQPQYLDVAAAMSECFQNCRVSKFPDRTDFPEDKEIDQNFEDHTLYDYLQICGYKAGHLEVAISATFTYLASHPGHEDMTSNINFYRSLPEAQDSYFYDREQPQFKTLYSKALESYKQQDWLGTVHYMEESVELYYSEVQNCLALCNAPLEPSKLERLQKIISFATREPDRKRILLEHWSKILECKEECRTKLDLLENGSVLKENYNYLQFSYYKINDIKRAAQCTGTYLHINPTDESTLFNKNYYSRHHQATANDFKPRTDAVEYVTERNKDDTLLQLVRHMKTEYSTYGSFSQDLEHHDNGASPTSQEIFGRRTSVFLKELNDFRARRGITEYGASETLLNNRRVAADGVISDDQCKQLMHLASVGKANGNMFRGATDYEKFEGFTVSQAAELAREGLVSAELVQLFLEASETGRAYLEKYLNLKITLMFQHTELVCRTALDTEHLESNKPRRPVHSDDCFIQQDGSCLKRPQRQTHRDFTGLLYLNDDFEGGDFYFAHRNSSEQVTLRPKCGRFIGFESEDYHGVLPMTSGRRCMLAALYTFNPATQELARAEAQTALRSISSVRTGLATSQDFQSLLARKGARVSLTEDDLSGSQRVAVDSFTTEDQCRQLIKLANMGVTSDGYESARNRLSPHTNYERFTGITVSLAAKLAAEHKVTTEAVKLYLSISRDLLEMARLYLTPNTSLYFSYTHLVCRTALNDKNVDRTDLSHPIHSDNCIIQPDNSCKKVRPAYTERDFSALLYLNDDFDGGNFFFTHQNMTVQSSLKPKCGRVVAFNSSHYHGVRPVLAGQRCAVATWLTLDKNFEETGHSAAWDVLGQLDSRAFGPDVQHSHAEL